MLHRSFGETKNPIQLLLALGLIMFRNNTITKTQIETQSLFILYYFGKNGVLKLQGNKFSLKTH